MRKFAFFFLIFPVVFIFILGHIGACVESEFCASALRTFKFGISRMAQGIAHRLHGLSSRPRLIKMAEENCLLRAFF